MTQRIETNLQTVHSEAPVSTQSITEYSPDNRLLKEIEQDGRAWVIGVYTDQLKAWKQTWKSNRLGEGKNQTTNARLRTDQDLLLTEGCIFQTQSLSQNIDGSPLFSDLNGPMNSDVDNQSGIGFFPCSQEIIVGNLKTGLIENRITHPIFNDLHSVSLNRKTNTILVVSSGADMIVEIDRNGQLLWQWDASVFADKYGLIDDAIKQRRSDLVDTSDYRKWVVPTPAQTTHINTATWLNEKQIGVTLFHQGIALVVDKESGDANIILRGLIKPHGFQPTRDGRFVVTSTGQGKILILDDGFQLSESITGFFDNHPVGEISWIHTSFPVDGKILAVDQTLAELIILDTQNRRIQRIKHSDDWKVSFVGRV